MHANEESMALARRALAHLNNKTTDQAPDTMEVPASAYSDPQRYRREVDRIFGRLPLPLAFSVELPGPQTYRAMSVAGIPVILVRGEDSVVRAFVNICRHRGAQQRLVAVKTTHRFTVGREQQRLILGRDVIPRMRNPVGLHRPLQSQRAEIRRIHIHRRDHHQRFVAGHPVAITGADRKLQLLFFGSFRARHRHLYRHQRR